jgi:hypothetical protein
MFRWLLHCLIIQCILALFWTWTSNGTVLLTNATSVPVPSWSNRKSKVLAKILSFSFFCFISVPLIGFLATKRANRNHPNDDQEPRKKQKTKIREQGQREINRKDYEHHVVDLWGSVHHYFASSSEVLYDVTHLGKNLGCGRTLRLFTDGFPWTISKFRPPYSALLVPWNEYIQVILWNKKRCDTNGEGIHYACVEWYKKQGIMRPLGTLWIQGEFRVCLFV